MRRELGCVLLCAVAACSRPAAPPAAPASGPAPSALPAATPTPVAVHVTSSGNGKYTTLTEMKNGRIIYTIHALSFEGDASANGASGGSGTFDRPHVVFVDRSGARTLADAPKAVLTSADKSVVMTGGVRAQTQDGDVLRCDRLRYNGRTETVHGDGNVVLTTPSGLTLSGDTLDGDVRLAHVRVSRRT